MKQDPYILSSVSHAMQIMDLLSKHERLGVADIHKELGMGKTSVFRILYTLEACGYVRKTSEAKYELSIKFAQYGALVINRQNLTMTARPHLQELRDFCNMAVHLAVFGTDGKSTFLYKESANSALQMGSAVGFSIDAYCTATGKMLLSQLPESELLRATYRYDFKAYTENTVKNAEELLEKIREIRERGYAEDNEESEIGLTCYAAPVYDISQKCVAAISISGPTYRMQNSKEAFIRELLETAARLSRELGYIPE